ADISDGMAPRFKDGARISGGDVLQLTVLAVTYQDASMVHGVVAVNHPQDRRLADATWTGEDGAFAWMKLQLDVVHHGKPNAAAPMHGECLADFLEAEQRRGGS